MALFEWITPEGVFSAWVLVGGILLIGAGVGNLYLGSVFSDEFVLFGVNGFVLAGVSQILAGVFLLISERVRPPLPSEEVE